MKKERCMKNIRGREDIHGILGVKLIDQKLRKTIPISDGFFVKCVSR